MGWLIETWLVNEDKEYFTGNMIEQKNEAEALVFAEDEANRIGDALGMPVIKRERSHPLRPYLVVVFHVGHRIEIRCKENKR